MENTEYKWFNCIKNSMDLIEDSQIFGIKDVFFDDRLNRLVEFFAENLKNKKTIRVALKASFDDLSSLIPNNTLRAEIRAVNGLERSVKGYEEEIFAKYSKRQMLIVGDNMASAISREEDSQHILDDAKASLQAIDECMSAEVEMTKSESFDILLDKIADMQNPNPDNFIKSGIKKLDDLIVGFQKKKHIIIGARPSIGKTAGGLTLALNARAQGKKVAFVSVEMTNDAIFSRACFNDGNIESDVFNPTGSPTQNDIDALRDTAQNLIDDDNIMFINPSRRCITDVARSMRKCKRDNPDLDMIVVDYLQKIHGTDKRSSPVEQIGECMGMLTDLCKSLDIVLVTLAQLSRDLDENAIPRLSKLKGASYIEEDADMVILLHRSREAQKDAQANGHTRIPCAKGMTAEDQDIRGLQCLWLLDKNRDGQTGAFITYYDAPVMKFNSEKDGGAVPHFDDGDQF